MTTTIITINGKQYPLNDKIGGGLEATVWRVVVDGQPLAFKLFIKPNDPSFNKKPDAADLRDRARVRLAELQSKLPSFPTNIPAQIMQPVHIVYDEFTNQIIGFTMPLLPDGYKGSRLYADPKFRRENGITNAAVQAHMIELHEIITTGHATRIIYGDGLSGNNVQFGPDGVRLIDCNTIITPGYPNRTHTRECVDPTLCRDGELVMNQDHTTDSDWFVFTLLLAWLYMRVHPYEDGIYTDDDEMSGDERAHASISTFNPKVMLPDGAITTDHLPKELIDYFSSVFEKQPGTPLHRGPFPLDILKNMVWTTCACGTEHAVSTCPNCGTTAAGGTGMRQGNTELTNLFTAPPDSNIVSVVSQDGNVRYAYADGKNIHRDGSSTVLTDVYTGPDTQVLICGSQTGVLNNNKLTVYNEDGTTAVSTEDVIDTSVNSKSVYWLTSSNNVMRSKPDGGTARLGQISGPPAQLWAGEEFVIGFWYSLSGRITVFNSENPGIVEAFALPAVPGTLVDAHCIFSSSVAWLFLTIERGGQNYNYCYVINGQGKILVSANEATAGDGSWLGGPIRLHAATGARLYTPTAAGIVRCDIEKVQGVRKITVSDPHTDSAPFVSSAQALLISGGMVVHTGTTINRLVNRPVNN